VTFVPFVCVNLEERGRITLCEQGEFHCSASYERQGGKLVATAGFKYTSQWLRVSFY